MLDDRRPPDGASPPTPPIVESGSPPDAGGAPQDPTPPAWSRLHVSSVFRLTIDTFLAHWRTFVVLTLPSAVASLGYVAVLPQIIADRTVLQPAMLLLVLVVLVGIWTTVAIAMAADDARAGRPVSARTVVGPAVVRSLVALLSAIVVGLIVFGLSVIAIALIGIIGFGTRGVTAAILPGLLILFTFFVPIFYVLIRWSLGPMAIALDGAGPLGGLNQSWRATKGNIWRLVVLLVGIGLLGYLWSAAGYLFAFGGYVPVAIAIGLVAALLIGPLSSIVVSLAYGDITGRPRADVAAPAEELAAAEIPATASTEPIPALAHAVEAGVSPAATSSVATSAAGPAPRTRSARRIYVLGVLVIGVILVIPAVAVGWSAFDAGLLAGPSVAGRGTIHAGTQRNAAAPCAPQARGTSFSSSETIYIGGYLSRVIMPGESATVRLLIDDVEVVTAPIEATTQMIGCFYEQEPLTGMAPGEYRIVIDDTVGVLAEGTFTIR